MNPGPSAALDSTETTVWMYADADICLFADDDVRYWNGYTERVLAEFARHPEADVILFNFHSTNQSGRNTRFQNGRASTGTMPSAMAHSRIAVRTARVQQVHLAFSLLFGGGARYGSGEDTIFYDCCKRGLRIYASPLFLGEVSHLTSTWFEGYTPKFFHDKGALLAHLFPRLAKPFGFLLLLRHPEFLSNGLGFQKAYQYLNEGIQEYLGRPLKRFPMKKRLIFVNNNLHSGGIQRSLLNLLANLQGQCQITLLLMSDTGEYREQLPPEIQVLHCPPLLRILGMSQRELWPKAKGLYFLRSFLVVLCRIIGNSLPLRVCLSFKNNWGLTTSPYPVCKASGLRFYTVAPMKLSCTVFKRRKKIAMVHADLLHCGSNTPAVRKLYGQFDSILTCSKGCRDHFLCAFPELRDLVRVVPNFHDFVGISYFSTRISGIPRGQNPCNYGRAVKRREGAPSGHSRLYRHVWRRVSLFPIRLLGMDPSGLLCKNMP